MCNGHSHSGEEVRALHERGVGDVFRDPWLMTRGDSQVVPYGLGSATLT